MVLELRAEGDILIWFDQYPFGQHRFEALSRSGNLPEAKKIGQLTFYYNGPGGEESTIQTITFSTYGAGFCTSNSTALT